MSFGDVVGGVRPLAGIRFESAGSVTTAGKIHVAGDTSRAFRHGIEILPGADNVDLRRGGTIRDFARGQAIHVAAGSSGSQLHGFRIVNSGSPFVGWSGPGRNPSLANNVIVAPVARAASAQITSGRATTTDRAPAISGTGRSGDRITLYADGTPVGSTIAVRGRWTIVPARLADGVHRLTVRATSNAGVASGRSAPVRLTVAAPSLSSATG